MWEIDIGVQTAALVYSVLLGVVSAVLYDVIRAVNKIFKPNIYLIFFLDIFYWSVLTLVFFIFFMVFSNGQVRMFAIFGALAGFLLFFLLFSKITMFLFCKILLVLRLVLNKIKAFLVFFCKAVKKIAKILLLIAVIFSDLMMPISVLADELSQTPQKGDIRVDNQISNTGSVTVTEGAFTNEGDVQVSKTVSKTDTLGRYKVEFEIKGKDVTSSTTVVKPV